MENNLLNVTPPEFSVVTNLNAKGDQSEMVGIHVLTADGVGSIDNTNNNVIEALPLEDHSQSVITMPAMSTDISTSTPQKDGEVSFNSSYIPENAILMETPRG